MIDIRDCETSLGCEVLNESKPPVATKTTIEEFLGNDNGDSSDSDDSSHHRDGFDVINWTKDVEKESAAMANLWSCVDDQQLSALYENKAMLLSIFKFMDTDGNGSIDPDEFEMGLNLLNKRLPEGAQFTSSEDLFKALDVDGSGTSRRV